MSIRHSALAAVTVLVWLGMAHACMAATDSASRIVWREDFSGYKEGAGPKLYHKGKGEIRVEQGKKFYRLPENYAGLMGADNFGKQDLENYELRFRLRPQSNWTTTVIIKNGGRRGALSYLWYEVSISKGRLVVGSARLRDHKSLPIVDVAEFEIAPSLGKNIWHDFSIRVIDRQVLISVGRGNEQRVLWKGDVPSGTGGVNLRGGGQFDLADLELKALNPVKTPKVHSSVEHLFSDQPAQISIACDTPGAALYYRLDEGKPVKYTKSFELKTPHKIRAIATKKGMQASAPGTLHLCMGRASDTVKDPKPGLSFAYYQGNWKCLPDFDALKPEATGTSANFDLSQKKKKDYFAFVFKGFVKVPANGIYTFSTTSDDGSRLYIGETLVVNNDGLHGTGIERSGSMGLQAGLHAITVQLLEATGHEELNVFWAGPTIEKQAIPDPVLFRE